MQNFPFEIVKQHWEQSKNLKEGEIQKQLIIAVNAKGGCGKTELAKNLGLLLKDEIIMLTKTGLSSIITQDTKYHFCISFIIYLSVYLFNLLIA